MIMQQDNKIVGGGGDLFHYMSLIRVGICRGLITLGPLTCLRAILKAPPYLDWQCQSV